ncbi:d31e6403-0893-47fd-9f41-ae986d0f9e18 [Thermothielavioides terrestris]|uniref:D31e6403-0893-47fd-9f41-ae986d0f9e18 n=1 Tax=Thermothielavioides terrestris TaxID=2587410 RepID=A0A446B5F0_9PEZI|nr:d31e6403-0893-47fd-9f41-ae986d0f9e18 [Thermothielavioides terrestris]
MKSAISAALIALLLGASLGQNFPECTQDLMQTDDCAAVIDPVACYNEFRWSTRTLQCIDGTDDADRKRKLRGPGYV